MPLYYLTEEEASAARIACAEKLGVRADADLVTDALSPTPVRNKQIQDLGCALHKLNKPESFVADVTVSAQQLQTATLKLREMNGPMSPGNLEGMAGGAVRLHHNGGIYAIDKLGTGRAVEEGDL